MRQNGISLAQLPGVHSLGDASRGSAGAQLKRAGAALESLGDRTSQFLAKEADHLDRWLKSR
jgi:hypothetical protein